MDTTTLGDWAMELRNGILPLAVLSQLESPKYSSVLIQVLEQRGLLKDPGALPPLLRRLEKQKLLIGNWDNTGKRPRKYYARTEAGREAFEQLNSDWQKVSQELELLLEGGRKHEAD